ncbi:MAG: YhdT family protein [Candidatus Aminicenantes bacterium]|jgi:uncharacterized membrane protein YhdT|nr:YhdT family protein [Candidatus Aminicenantes bacterium]
MKFIEDSRVKISRKIFTQAWIYYALYLLFIMGSSYLLGIRPYIWGLPRWVFIGNIIVPVVFVLLLIFLAERFIPDIPLTKDEDSKREE